MSVLDDYEVRLSRRRRTPETVQNVQRMFQRFDAWCSERGINPDLIDPVQMEEYFDELGLEDSTRRNHLVNLRAAYTYGLRRGVIPRDPTIDVYIPPKRENIPRILSGDELRAMRDACSERRAELHFHMFAYTGMRRAEVCNLPWDQVDLANRTINVIGKGDKRRVVPIHPTLGEVLADNYAVARSPWIFPGQNGTITDKTSSRILSSYSNSATHHDFRRTVATSLDANGVEEPIIEEIMGWAKRGMLARHYRFIAPERLQQAIQRLYANDPL